MIRLVLLSVFFIQSCAGYRHASWISDAPEICAAGAAGPTLNPSDALYYARTDAMNNLLTETEKAVIKSAILSSGNLQKEVTLEEIQGRLEGSFIAEVYTDKEGKFGGKGATYALACRKGALVGNRKTAGAPVWVMNPPFSDGEVCAVGIAGPTITEEDQKEYGFEDGLMRLAEGIAANIETLSLEIDRDEREVFTDVRTKEASIEGLREKCVARSHWKDEKGIGPLAGKGLLYVLVCLTNPNS